MSQKSDEDDFVKLEDIPLKLAVYSEVNVMLRNIQSKKVIFKSMV